MPRYLLVAFAGLAVWAATAGAAGDPPILVVRLTSHVSTADSKAGDKIAGVNVTSLVSGGKTIATPGCTMPGIVLKSLRPKGVNEREVMAFEFTTIVDADKVSHTIKTKLIDVDNARETVNQDGDVLGVAPVDKKPENPSDVLKTAANGGQIMRALVSKVIGRVPPQIDYKAGAELIFRVTELPAEKSIMCRTVPPELAQNKELTALVNGQPLHSLTPDDASPSDVTNLLFVGPLDWLQGAFSAAGWVTAEAIGATSSAKTFLATIAGEGYAEAPVSVQHINGRSPDAVFQKQLNTFAERHHVRIWQTDKTFADQQVWIAAATHDNAIVAAKDVKLFTHSIDPDIDEERLKIVDDLSFAGAVASHTLVPRPKAPRESENSTGITVRTDGKMAVIVLQKAPKK
ncbi:MAG TPA: LssY C-terminal domain-containing protein [Vicinamibacterales bacterium]|nr:LssY C-terminal domain-containing protein [Vicinamibacterales bacterium]